MSPQVGKWTKAGVRIPWKRRPTPKVLPQKSLSAQECVQMDEEVERMLAQGAIRDTTHRKHELVLSSVYTISKKGSTKRRPITNLRWVNTHIHTAHFKMTTVREVKAAIRQGDFMAKVDLADCFWGVPVHKDDQPALSFQWKGRCYSYQVLPFGLSVSPLFITKTYREVVKALQAEGHRIIIYVDDILVLGSSREQADRSTAALRKKLQDLGAVINEDKCSKASAQQIEYLGFNFDSVAMTVRVPAPKLRNLRKELRKFTNKTTASPREVASLLGKIQAMADALFPARVHTAGLHQLKLLGLQRGSWDGQLRVSDEARDDARWWIASMADINGRTLLPMGPPDATAATDASDDAWGAWVTTSNGTVAFGGQFTARMHSTHINYKELVAVFYLLRSAKSLLKGKRVDLGIDNTCALAYVARLGGRKLRLARLADKIYDFMRRWEISLVPHYVPSAMNTLADRESRRTAEATDWKLHPQVFQAVDRAWGPHSADLFATFQNRQTVRFAGWSPQPDAIWVDSMVQSWAGEPNPWVHPPYALIGAILNKVQLEGTTITLVAPVWPAQPWWPTLLEMAQCFPLLLPCRRDLLLRPPGGGPPRQPPWMTCAWRISGEASRRVASMMPRCARWRVRGSGPLREITTVSGGDGLLTREQLALIRSTETTLSSLHGW